MLKRIIVLLFLLGVSAAVYFYVIANKQSKVPEGFAVGNGRIETTQVDISSKLAGRLVDISVEEGSLIQKDEILASLDIKELNAKLQEVTAYKQQAIENKNYTLAIVQEKESALNLVKKNYNRANSLYQSKSIPLAEYQKNEAELQSCKSCFKCC
jgi:HlyD family secretion protein